MSEFIYVLENPSMPGIVKIGRTDRTVSERVSELSSHTGVPTQFIVVKEYSVADSVVAENKIHERLSEYRVSENREFFKLPAEDAAMIIDSILENKIETNFSGNFERREALIAEAINISIQYGTVYPGLFVGLLKVSYEEAELLIRSLRESGCINAQNEAPRWQHENWLREDAKRQRLQDAKNKTRAERHSLEIEHVKKLLDDLQDPETGESPDISFECENEDLVVKVRGTEWLRTEAQKRLAHLF